MKTFNKFSLLGLLAIGLLVSCDKTKPYETKIAEPQAHFTGNKNQIYSVVTNPPPAYKITIGTTDVSDANREVGYTLVKSAGAIQGTDFTITPADKVTIAAGQATADITIQANYASYTAGQKDTLTFYLKEPSVKPAGFSDTIRLVLRGPCFDGDISANGTLITVMNGNYANTREPSIGYGPYTSSISGLVQPATGTTSSGSINNVFDTFGPLVINFDWTDPNNVKVNIPLQQTNTDYAPGQPFLVRSSPGQQNKFSVCNQTLTMTIDVIVNNYPAVGQAAYYDQNYPITMGK